MRDIEAELRSAIARRVGPPQDWVSRAADEIAALRKDAERYRFLRRYIVDSYIACGSHERLDAEVDAAMTRPPAFGAA